MPGWCSRSHTARQWSWSLHLQRLIWHRGLGVWEEAGVRAAVSGLQTQATRLRQVQPCMPVEGHCVPGLTGACKLSISMAVLKVMHSFCKGADLQGLCLPASATAALAGLAFCAWCTKLCITAGSVWLTQQKPGSRADHTPAPLGTRSLADPSLPAMSTVCDSC